MGDKILIDSNFLVAFSFPQDSHNLSANRIISQAISKKSIFILNNYILSEAFTVILIRTKDLSKVGFLFNELFVKNKSLVKLFYIKRQLDKKIFNMFSSQKKYKGEFLSYADCSLIVQARREKIKTIFTFDKTFEQLSREFRIVGI